MTSIHAHIAFLPYFPFNYLLNPVIDELDLDALRPLGNNHIPYVFPLALDHLEPPDLRRRPAAVLALDIRDDVLLAVGAALLLVPLQEPCLQILVVDVLDVQPPRLPLDRPKEPVAVVAEEVVEAALLRGALDAARADLVDLDVRDGAARGLSGRGGRRVEVLDVERERAGRDRLAGQPADALEGEDWVKVAGLGFVLYF